MSNLAISNVINISVSQSGKGVGSYNTSNLALFTADEFDVGTFGADPYKLYLDAIEVGKDFGTTSKAYKMALAVFSQNPNILANNGYLAIVPLIKEVQTITPGSAPTGGSVKFDYDGTLTGLIAFDATAADIQTALRLIAGLEGVVVTGTFATVVTVTFQGLEGDAVLLAEDSNTLTDGGAVALVFAETVGGETVSEAIVRTEGLIQYFGIMASTIEAEAEMLASAATVQALNKIQGVVSKTAIDCDPGGKLDKLATGTLTKTRGLYYGGTEEEALIFLASYMGRAFSTNFSGDNTTQTMHLKDLSGVQPDPTVDQTLLNKCKLAGVDVYISIEGVSKTFTSGANEFFDDVYNLEWIVGAISVAGFNVLATASTKLPQTEAGVSVLKGAYRKVCEQGITNQYLAPGEWDNPTTFGVQADLYDNIRQRGYYIYSTPIAQQSPVDRAARKAPIIQIAIKYAGAEHSSSVIVNINK